MVSVGKRGSSVAVGRSIGAALMLPAVLALASCNPATMSSSGNQDIDVLDKVRSLDIAPRYPTQTGSTTTSTGQRVQPVVYQGTEVTDNADTRPQTASSGSGGSGFDLNFESAPVATVAKVVL